MNEIVVCSGKGGTGKTSLTASLAALAGNLVVADADVDAANLHLVLEPTTSRSSSFVAGDLARIREQDCLGCGTCASLCRYDAIIETAGPEGPSYRIDATACEGCGVCAYFCATDAIDLQERRCGEWSLSQTRFGPLVHASLDIGAENSGKLVSLVRKQARLAAERSDLDLILVDGPPGLGCPVTAAITGADLVLVVTEPSLAGLHDLKRILGLIDHFSLPALVCINKADLHPQLSDEIAEYCRSNRVPLVGRIPFEPLVREAQLAGRSLVEFAPRCEAARITAGIWHRIE